MKTAEAGPRPYRAAMTELADAMREALADAMREARRERIVPPGAAQRARDVHPFQRLGHSSPLRRRAPARAGRDQTG
jgi:hypothetical protein